MRNPEVALEVHAREELGLQPGKTGNPWQAAGSSFVMFSIGAVIPLFPWFFVSGTTAALLSIVLGAVSVLASDGRSPSSPAGPGSDRRSASWHSRRSRPG